MAIQAGPGKGRLLFCSFHCYVDPSNGAAQATRDLLTLLAARGWTCGVYCGSHLDFEHHPSIESVLRAHGIAFSAQTRRAEGKSYTLYHFGQQGVPVTIFDMADSRPPDPPTLAEGKAFLALLDGVLDRFGPDLVLTYGGHWLAREIIARSKRRGRTVAFALHNFAYQDASLFDPVDGVLVPSQYAREHYRRTLGLECTVLPGPWQWDRLCCPQVQGQYVTFINPQPEKGVFWFARLAAELGQRRPDIPLLVVEGRGRADWLAQTGIDLSGVQNLYRMANTADPRHFYSVSRAVLMPSLWWESLPRVAVEACLNGIPVLGSRRGGLPEALAQAGFLFDIPSRYQPESRFVPSAAEVAPWIDTLIRLWDDADFREHERQRCLAAAAEWHPDRLLPRFEVFFTGLIHSQTRQLADQEAASSARSSLPRH